MSLFEEETGEIKAASKRLGALFGSDDALLDDGNSSFQYEAATTTQASENGGGGKNSEARTQEPRETSSEQLYTKVPEGNRILFATTITQLYKTDGSSSEAVACGAAGVALIEESPRNISLVVYDRKKTPFFRLVIGKSFVFIPQKSNYMCVYDESAIAWNLLFSSEAESEKFAWSLTCAKMTASTVSLEAKKDPNANANSSNTGSPNSKDASGAGASSSSSSDDDVVTQDYSYSEDEKIAEVGDTVQVKFSAWVNKSLQARHISQDEILVRESTAKLEVGKTSSSIPNIVCTSVLGMKRGSKRLALKATLEPDLSPSASHKVYSTQAYELTLCKIKKGKGGTPRSKRGRGSTTGSFSEDAIPTIKRKESSDSSIQQQQAATTLEPVDESSVSVSPNKSDKQSLIERMAKLSAAQNPLAASFNVFGQSKKLSSSPTSPAQASPPAAAAAAAENREEVVGTIASPSQAAVSTTQEEEESFRNDQDSHPEEALPPKASQKEEEEETTHLRRKASENAARRTSATRAAPKTDDDSATTSTGKASKPQPNQMLMQIPPGWHYFAPPEAMPPPPTTASTSGEDTTHLQASVHVLSSQMKQLLCAQETLQERLEEMNNTHKDKGEKVDHPSDPRISLECIRESFGRLVSVFKMEFDRRDDQEASSWEESSVKFTIEAAVQVELEELEKRMEE